MAKATIELTCTHCGETFTKVKFFNNRQDAENYAEWAKENMTECPNCYKARMAEERAGKANDLISKYDLPQIQGVSEKQTKYASDLRLRLVRDTPEEMLKKVPAIIDSLNGDQFKKVAEANFGGNLEKAQNAYFEKNPSIKKLVTIFTQDNAHNIIEALR